MKESIDFSQNPTNAPIFLFENELNILILLRRAMLSARRIPLARIKSYSLWMCRQIYVVLCMRYYLCSHQLNVGGKHSLLLGKYITNIRKNSHLSNFSKNFHLRKDN